jgi:two-component system LytT family response regulator
MLRVLIADDEPAARAKLVRLLQAHADVDVVATASTGREAGAAILAHTPDLVLLDIRMPEMDGFGVVEALGGGETRAPQVIFVTAFDEYAVQAFEVRALDYVLKPYDAVRLADALERARQQTELEQRPTAAALRAVLDRTSDASAGTLGADAPGQRYLEHLSIRTAGRAQFIAVREVEWIEAYGNYIRVHTPARHTLARETLRNVAERLDPAQFCRIHRSAVVNVARIVEMKPAFSGDSVVRMESGIRLRVSRSFRPDLDRLIAAR